MDDNIYELLWIVEYDAKRIYQNFMDISESYMHNNIIEININEVINDVKLFLNRLEYLKNVID